MPRTPRPTRAIALALLTAAAASTQVPGLPPGLAAAAPARPASAPTSTPSPTGYTDLRTVSGWGGFDSGQSEPPASLVGEDVVDVAAAADHSLAVTADGVVVGWGWNGDGQVAPPAPLRDGTWRAVAVETSDHHAVALLDDGGVVAWGAAGDTDEGQTEVPAALAGPDPADPVVDLDAGRYHSVALTADGDVVTWGARDRHGDVDEGQLDVPDPLEDGTHRAVDVAAGARHSLAVDESGRVWAWGSNVHHQREVPDELDDVEVTAVEAYGAVSMALTAGGRVVAWGDDGTGTVSVPATVTATELVEVDVSSEVAMGLTADGDVVTWGDGATRLPASIARHAPFTGIAAGGRHELVVHRAPKAATRLALSAPARAAQGRPVTVRVTLTGATGGTVTVHDGARRVGTVALRPSGERAVGTLVLRRLSLGRHRLQARFAGTDLAAASVSPVRTTTVTR